MNGITADIWIKMLHFYEGSLHDINHFIKVHSFAKFIGEKEGLCGEAMDILECAAIVHDIACPLCREKYGSARGDLQEAEGMPMTEDFLAEFALPESFYYEIPGNPTGKCTLSCTTYLGNTQIGEKQTCVFTVTAAKDQCAPLVTAQAEDVNEATVALTGNAAVLVRYASNAKCTITATPRFGATIRAKTVEGVAVEDAVILPAKDGYVFAATDSRGYTTSVTLTPRVIPYVILTCRATAKRDDPTSGKATLTA